MLLSGSTISLELLGVFKINRKEYVNLRSHTRSYDTLSIRLSGQGDFKTQKGNFSVAKGDVLYIPKNLEYQQTSDNETLVAIHFINHGAEKDADAEVIHIDDSEYAEELFQKMYDTWKGLNVGYQYKCISLLYELLYHLRCHEHNTVISSVTDESKIKKALDFIHANYRNSRIEISHLAKLCALSETYFRKLFKNIHGSSPVQYIIDLRLDFATHLLRSGLYTVNETASRSGFSDTKYFARILKLRFGISPKQYQKICQSSAKINENEQMK